MWRTEHKHLFFLLFVASLCADAGGAEHIGASARGKHLSISVFAKTPSCPSALLHRARNGGQLHGREFQIKIVLRGGGIDRSDPDEGQVSEESLKNFDLETHLDELMATGDALIKQGEQLCGLQPRPVALSSCRRLFVWNSGLNLAADPAAQAVATSSSYVSCNGL
jgi:hypothetical protein